jgi:hypothetical protein
MRKRSLVVLHPRDEDHRPFPKYSRSFALVIEPLGSRKLRVPNKQGLGEMIRAKAAGHCHLTSYVQGVAIRALAQGQAAWQRQVQIQA